MEEMEHDLSVIERRQEEKGKAMELIAQQLGQLLRERRTSRLPEGKPEHLNLEREYM